MRGLPRRVMLALGPALLLVTGSGCAGPPPTEQLASADTMVRRAEQDGANQFAPLPLRQAKDKLESAQREVERSEYESARLLAEQAEVDAQLALAETERARVGESVRELSKTIADMESELGFRPGGTPLPPVASPPRTGKPPVSTSPSIAPSPASPITAPRQEIPR